MPPKRVSEEEVHHAEGRYVPIQLLGQLGADEERLYHTIAAVCHHSNLSPRGAAAHLAHAAMHELEGGAKLTMSHVMHKAAAKYGKPHHQAHHRASHARGGLALGGMALGGAECGGLAMGGLAMGGYDAMYDGGFSFSDFISGAKKAAAKAKEYAKKALPYAQQVHAALPQAASFLDSIGLKKASSAATKAHAKAQALSDQYGSDVMDIIGSGGAVHRRAHKRGYARH